MFATHRVTVYRDYYQFSLTANPPWFAPVPDDEERMSAGFGSPVRFDGLISRWKHNLRIHTGQPEMGDTAVDLGWADTEPAGIYDQEGLVSAVDVRIPDGRLALIGYDHALVEEHQWPGADRCRVVVAARGRDNYLYPGRETQEIIIVAWPTEIPQPWWTNGNLDDLARMRLEDCYEVPIRPIQHRDNWWTNDSPYAHDEFREHRPGRRLTAGGNDVDDIGGGHLGMPMDG